MNLRKIIVGLSFVLTLVIITSLTSVVYAAQAPAGQELSLGITEFRKHDTPNMAYAIGDPEQGGAKIWNIEKYISADAIEQGNIYCLKAGVGFTESIRERATYNIFFDMKKEQEAIAKQNAVLASIVEGTVDMGDGTTVSKYNSILALLDLFYLPYGDKKSPESDKESLINEIIKYAQVPENGYTNYVSLIQQYPLTTDDITAVQQSALWYFTNYHKKDDTSSDYKETEEHDTKYDKTENVSWLNYKLNASDNYDTLSNYTPNNLQPQYDAGQARSYQAEILYNYLIKTAKQNASQYENTATGTLTKSPAKVTTTTLNYVEEGSNFIVGPIHIKSTEGSTTPYTIDFYVKNGTADITNYDLLVNNAETNEKEKVKVQTIKELVDKDFYVSVPKENIITIKVGLNISYNDTKATLWASSTNNAEQPVVIPENDEVEDPVEFSVTPNQKIFDLALRKYITKINNNELLGTTSRVPNIDKATLTSGTTATYKHKKDPVVIETGDQVTYKLTIYNEGEKAGYATKIVDQLPTGVKFVKVLSGNFDLESYNETTNTLNLKRKAGNVETLVPYANGELDSETIEIVCEVTATPDTVNSKILTNVAWIAEEVDSETNVIITNQKELDRDSEPLLTKPSVDKDSMSNYTGNGNKEDLADSNYYYKGQQDDDDFEKLILLPESFDLKLIKRITAINSKNVPERIKNVDVSKLNTLDANGKMVTTADYEMVKTPIGVKKGDIVTYTFRIYNEGTIDGYASEITEDIPEGLQFLWSEKEGEELKADTTFTDKEKEAIEFNQKYLWGNFKYDDKQEKIVQISTDYLSKENETTVGGNLITAFGKNDGNKTESDLKYKEVSVMLKVISEDVTGTIIRNEAEISEDTNGKGEPVVDRDSDTEDWEKENSDKYYDDEQKWPIYKEDDEDYDNIILQTFDLALRKFIVAVSKDDKIEENEYLKNDDGSYTRAPIVDTSKLNKLDDNRNMITTATYNHTKEPVLVQFKDKVVYMLRVYNEGDIDGYAAEIKDHLPTYLEFVDNEFNEKYGWEVSEDGRTVTTTYLKDSKLSKTTVGEDGKIVLSYKEVPIMCQVKDTAKTNENITNIADITVYLDEEKSTVVDRDSQENNVVLPEDGKLPTYKDEEKGSYVPGQQDDDDFEKIIVKKFDLALRKWVTQAIVTENGKQSVTNTGHQPYDDPEQVVKVELHRKKLDKVTVKFRYSIRVINEGEIAGYAKEVTDYIPQGLKFVASDNPGWTDEGNNVISTKLLQNTLLQPGEYADVEVLLTWVNNKDNMGLMINTAEISEDYNQYDVPDIDSTPDNKVKGEDDIDDAPVILMIKTGQTRIYFTLGFIILITIASGIVLIRKYVL